MALPAQPRYAAAFAHEETLAGARGSEWHRWDPHLHAPGTLQADEYPAADGWEHYLQALESASPVIHAIGVTDYCVTRSYELVEAKPPLDERNEDPPRLLARGRERFLEEGPRLVGRRELSRNDRRV